MYLTRSSVVWRINVIIHSNPSRALLRSMVPGRDGCLVTPPRCPFTIFIGLSAREGDPCDAIRDIELREACPDGERETTPLFADEDGSPLTANLEMCTLDGCAPCFAAIRAKDGWHA